MKNELFYNSSFEHISTKYPRYLFSISFILVEYFHMDGRK